MLAASFVVVVPSAAGCRKTSGGPHGESVSIYRSGNECHLSHHFSCPRGVHCNPPPPARIDCPPSLRDAGEPEPVTRRPSGKEDWLRVKPALWVGAQCTYNAEYFCAPPGRPDECTSPGPAVTVPCKLQAQADGGPTGSYELASFVYQDGLGACRRVPAMTCSSGRCEPPDGDVVPCP